MTKAKMTKALLISTAAAVAMVFGAGLAAAQGNPDNKSIGASPAPPAQQNAPAEKVAPPLKSGEPSAKQAENSGEAGQEKTAPGETPKLAPETGSGAVPSKSEIPENKPEERGRLQNDSGR